MFDDEKKLVSEREELPEIKYEVINNIGVDEKVVIQAQKAALAVWEKHFPGKSTTIHIGFYDQILDIDGIQADRIAEYDPDTDQIHYGIENIKKHMLNALYSFDQEKFFFLISAHETMHKVQIQRGDKIEGDPLHFSSQQALDYADSIHEDEAWIEAFESLSNEYPDFSMDINLEGQDGVKTYMTERRKAQLATDQKQRKGE